MMLMLMITRQCTPLAVDPAGIAIDVVFFLPDRHAVFHFIDDVAAGAEGLVAMRGADPHPDSHVANSERAETMHAGRARDAETFAGLGDDACTFLLCKFDERLVLQPRNCQALVVIAHPAFEGCEAAAGVIAHGALQRRGIECALAEGKRRGAGRSVHPPATGGTNTTASPALSGCDHSP